MKKKNVYFEKSTVKIAKFTILQINEFKHYFF